MLARPGYSTNILFHSLKNDFEIETVILEKPVAASELLKKRIKKLGWWKVAGQLLFQLSIAKILKRTSRKRKKEILKEYGLENTIVPENKIMKVASVNSSECIEALQKVKPELIIVCGTRIISKSVLESLPVRFMNIHAGITPKYRNVHGGYWALVNNDMENCGVTVHLVDEGIDTGTIIYQQKIPVTKRDNFATYPVLQLAEGIIYLKRAINDFFENKLILQKNNLESRLWYHPTIWQYIFYRIVYNKK
jgi:folate-dependent phosphoribosylglycinamide formyltransferase PurN